VQQIPREDPLRFEMTRLRRCAVAADGRPLIGLADLSLRIKMAELYQGRRITGFRSLPDQRFSAGKILVDTLTSRVKNTQSCLCFWVTGLGRPLQQRRARFRITGHALSGNIQIGVPVAAEPKVRFSASQGFRRTAPDPQLTFMTAATHGQGG
jgi:hypothetical protein